jgi:hypothetical protein
MAVLKRLGGLEDQIQHASSFLDSNPLTLKPKPFDEDPRLFHVTVGRVTSTDDAAERRADRREARQTLTRKAEELRESILPEDDGLEDDGGEDLELRAPGDKKKVEGHRKKRLRLT